MQSRYMSTDVFLRLEKEWQHMRHVERHLELEAKRSRSDSTAGPEPAKTTQTPQVTVEPSPVGGMDELISSAAGKASLRA